MLHELWWHGVELATPRAVMVYAAIWVLARPGSVVRFAVLLVAEVVAFGLDLPHGGSHVLLLVVVGLFALAQLAWATLRTRAVPAPGAVFLALAPFLRAAIVVVYAAAALSKLNTGFLDPVTSCARSMSAGVTWFDPSLLGDWRVGPAIVGTVVVEVALPVLLTVRRTRLLGVVLGLGFHVVLGFAGNVPFSGVAIAFYVAFLPLDTRFGRRRVRRWPQAPVVGVLLAAWLAAAALQHGAPTLTHDLVSNGTRLVVLVLALVGTVGIVASRHGATEPPVHQPRAVLVRHPLLLGGTLVLLGIAACPYLGLKTDSSFEMFSGLRTDPGAWSSVVVPEAVRVFDDQDGAVHVVASSDPALVARTAGGVRIVPFELERYLRTHPGVTATVVADGGTPYAVGPLPQGQTLAERLAVFRDLAPPGTGGCGVY